MKSYRQSIVLELVDRAAVTSQEQLRASLRERGIEVTQATLSRDIRDLGLVKRAGDGAYSRPGVS
jgi:transcriptional regulator of arginine metabolism